MDYSAVPADDVQAAYDGRYLRPQAEDEQEDIAYHGGGESSLMGKAELSFDSDEDKDKITGKILSSLIALALTYVGSQITQLFVGVTGFVIAADLNISSDDFSWIGTSINLGYVVTAPTAGYLQDMFGRRNILIVGSICNILGGITIATSHGLSQLIVGGVISGMGSAITELTTTAAMAEIVPVQKRGLVLALNASMLILFTPSFLYSQLITAHTTWRWVFYICVAWTAAAFVALLLTYVRSNPQRPHVHGTRRAAAKNFDYVGILLLAAGVILLLVGTQTGGNSRPWTSARVLCELIVGVGLILLVPAWEYFFAKSPLIPGRLFRGQRIVASLFVIDFISEMNFSTSLNLGPVIFKEVYNPTSVTLGLYGLPSGVALAAGSILFNVMISVLRGRARELLTTASLMMAVFTAAQVAVTPTNPAVFIPLGALAIFGVGGIDLPSITVVTTACPEDLIGTAVALLTTIRTLGGAVGYALFYNIFQANAHKKVPQNVGEYAVLAGLPESKAVEFASAFAEGTFNSNSTLLNAASELAGGNQAIIDAGTLGFKWGMVDAVRSVFYTSIPFGVLAVVLCVTLPNISKLMTNKVLVKHD